MMSPQYAFTIDPCQLQPSSLSHPSWVHKLEPLSDDKVDLSPARLSLAHRFLTMRTHEAALSDTRIEEMIISGQV